MSLLARVVISDCPWSFGDKLPGATRGADKNYDLMTLDEIKAYKPAHEFIAENAILFLWRVSSQVEEAYEVVRVWGFVPKSELVWVKLTKGGVSPSEEIEGTSEAAKLHFGMGHYTRASHETCIIAVRGKFKVANRSTRSVFYAPVGRHSAKPECFYNIVEGLAGGEGPFVEFFAREPRNSWHSFGNELPGGYVWTPGSITTPMLPKSHPQAERGYGGPEEMPVDAYVKAPVSASAVEPDDSWMD